MNNDLQTIIRRTTGAEELLEVEVIQNLWSDYGQIVRYNLKGSSMKSVVVKHVRLPEQNTHPRGWNTDVSHARKIRSYQVEMAWYQQWNQYCDKTCRTPKCLAFEAHGDETLLVLEDLNEAGYSARRTCISHNEIKTCLAWLASFHVTFLGKQPKDLWELGTYWHLDTRPDELKALADPALKNAAAAIDQQLRNSPFQTFVHGDAKLANFCFSQDGKKVAAVDFQYVGGGCGIKDVAYFIGSCLDEDQCQQWESKLLDYYFHALHNTIKLQQKPVDGNAIEQSWRALFPVAWTDFHRFLKGWSPEHWKINDYSERLAREVITQFSSKA